MHRDIKPENIFLNDVIIKVFRVMPKLEILDVQFLPKVLEIQLLVV